MNEWQLNSPSSRNYRQEKLRSTDGRVVFANPNESIISLPEIPPYPEPLHEWYESAQVTDTLRAFDEFLGNTWAEYVAELNES